MATVKDYLATELVPIAEGIARRRGVDVDLVWMNGAGFAGDVEFPSMIAEILAREVERFSGGEVTVRRVNPIVSKTIAGGRMIYMVRCPADTPEGIVQYPSESMDLVLVGPYKGGYHFGGEMYDRAEIDRLKTQQEAHDQQALLERARRNVINEVVDARLVQINQALEHFLDLQTDEWAKQRAEQLLWGDAKRIPLSKLLEICALLGVSLEEVASYRS